jgi:torulene dioxygenase
MDSSEAFAFLSPMPVFSCSGRGKPSVVRLKHVPVATMGEKTQPPVSSPSPSSSKTAGRQAGFRTVPETQPPISLSIHGKIPRWLNGTLARVGPAVFEAYAKDGSKIEWQNWADCLPYVHRWSINGKAATVSYDSRHIARHVERAIAAVPTASCYEPMTVGTHLDRSWHRKLLTLFWRPTRDKSTPKSECFPVGVTIERDTTRGSYFLTTDAPLALQLGHETLEPERFVRYSDLGAWGAPGIMSQMACAHVQHCEREGAYYNLLMSVISRNAIRIVRADADTGVAKIFARIENCPPTFVHSFAMTERYIVVVVGSVRVHAMRLLRERCFTDSIEYDENAKTRIHLVCRKSGRHVSTHVAEPSFTFHTVNAFDSGPNEVTVDLCCYKDATALTDLTVEQLSSSNSFKSGVLSTYTIPNIDKASPWRPWEAHHVFERYFTDLPDIDLPCINPNYKHRRHQFVYGVIGTFEGLVKIDRESGRAMSYRHEGKFMSEPVLVPRPQTTARNGKHVELVEDDGVILFVELDSKRAKGASSMVILDARTMTEVARCVSNVIVPFSFHGQFWANG